MLGSEVRPGEFAKWTPKTPEDDVNLAPTQIIDLNEPGPTLEIDVRDTEPQQPDHRNMKISARELKAFQKQVAAEEASLRTQAQEALHIEGVRDIEKTLKKLWPEGKETTMKQGRGGDCYEIAAFHSLKGSHEAFLKYSEHIFDRGNGDWDFEFFDEFKKPKGEWVRVSVNENQLNDGKKGLEGSLGDKLVERAYKSFISRQRTKEEGHTMEMRKVEVNGKVQDLMPWEAGNAHKALFHFLGPEYHKNVAPGQEKMVEALHVIAAYRRDSSKAGEILANIFTKKDFPNPEKEKKPWWKVWKKESPTPKNVFAAHAYSLGEIDFQKGSVEIINPHDTSKPSALSFQDFFKYFGGISYVQKAAEGVIASNQTMYH